MLWGYGMDTIFAPWRSAYIRGEKPMGCVLCKDAVRGDGLVLCEGKSGYIMVNRYPYTCLLYTSDAADE